MKKQLALFLILVLSLVCLSTPVLAEEALPLLVDDCNLFSPEEADELSALLTEKSEMLQMDFVLVTTPTLNGKTAMAYADDFFDFHGYGQGENRDGVLFLISMEGQAGNRDFWISTSGYGITLFTDYGIRYATESVVPDLANGDYAEACRTLMDLVDFYQEVLLEGKPFDADNNNGYDIGPANRKNDYDLTGNLILALVLGLVAALLITSIMKRTLCSVQSQPDANAYIRDGSFVLHRQKDIYLYRTVNRTRRETQSSSGGSSTHTSSSGSSHGGGGGKF